MKTKIVHLSTTVFPGDVNVKVDIKLIPGKEYSYSTSKYIESKFGSMLRRKLNMKAFNFLKRNSILIT